MQKARVGAGLLFACWLLGSGKTLALPPTAEDILNWRPRQQGVLYSVPTPTEVAACKVEGIKGKPKGFAWLLRDPQGRPLRRLLDSQFDDSKGKLSINVISFYYEGIETYREILVNGPKDPEQWHYRWFNAGGMKWGVSSAGEEKLVWKAISPEEVSQEVLLAVVKKDFARLESLLITEAELKALGLPADQAQRILALRGGAKEKFQATVGKMTNLNDNTHWVHLELGAPQCLPADQTGARADLVRYARGTVLCETGGKNDWLQTGEIVQIGPANWRLLDAPTPGQDEVVVSSGGSDATNPELQKLLKELGDLDGKWAQKPNAGQVPAEYVRYNLDRTVVLEKILAAVKPEEQDQWIRQEADCLSTAAQSSPDDRKAGTQLKELVGKVQKTAKAGSPLLAYVTFREMQADNSYRTSIAKGTDFAKVQQAWSEQLAKFVADFPNAEHTPEALLQLGWANEVLTKETEAKNWYDQLVKRFADTPQAKKAGGALKRLDLDGRELELTSTTLAGTAFDLASQRGKTVVVYYWDSWNSQSVGDFAKLKLLLDTYSSKGLELVTVNLDSSADEANAFIKKVAAPGTHLFEAGGADNKLAVNYGVMMLPTLFLVNKDGKVVNRSLQVSSLEDELKKLLK